IPPDIVPALFVTRLLAICRLCPQPCTKTPPPPCELFSMVSPSMLDGLQRKLLGNGLWAVLVFAPQPRVELVVPVRRTVPGGNTPAVAAEPPKISVAPFGICTPF